MARSARFTILVSALVVPALLGAQVWRGFPATSQVTDDSPYGLAAADFNEDGIMDIVVANYASDSMSVLLGNGSGGVGNGTFGVRTDYLSGGGTNDAATGDFNEDGIIDIVVANAATDNLSVRLGNGSGGVGNGTFGARVNYAAGDGSGYVLTGDFNEDGITDLATANLSSDNVSVLLGNGTGGVGSGTFGTRVNYAAGDGCHELAAGDFNEDGITDLVTANSNSDNVSILLGNGSGGLGNGTFAAAVAYGAGDGPRSVAVGDLNEDGIVDLVVTALDSGMVSVLPGNGSGGVGNGTFGTKVDYATGSGSYCVALDDFDEDGILDIVAANFSGDSVSVLRGNGTGGVGNGTFGAKTDYVVGDAPGRLLTGDFTADGIVDVVVSNSSSGTVVVLRGNGGGGVGNGTFTTRSRFAAGDEPYSIATGDFNEDGIADLVVPNSNSNNVSVLLGNGSGGAGNGTFAAAANYGTGTFPSDAASADFNGDGIADLAVANLTDTLSILLGNGSGGVGNGTFATAVTYAAGDGPYEVATGDFNEDGDVDLAVACVTTGVSVFLGNGDGSFPAPVNYPAGSSTRSATTGDFNEDGITDLAATNGGGTQGVYILLGNGSAGIGDGTFAAGVIYAIPNIPIAVATGDFNEDGITDLTTANTGDSVSVLLGNGSAGTGNGTFAAAVDYAIGEIPWGVNTGDFDNDGITDIVATNAASDSVSVLLGNGSAGVGNGTFATAVSYGAGTECYRVETGDFNADGFTDLVVHNLVNDGVSILFNLGSNSGLVISEYMANPANSADSAGEYFEVFNPTGAAIDINGWTIRDSNGESHAINNGGPLVVASRDHMVLGRSALAPQANDYVYGNGITFDDAEDEIVLESSPGVADAHVGYGSGPGKSARGPAPVAGAAQAIDDVDSHVGGGTTASDYVAETTPLGNGDFGSPGNFGASLPVELDQFLVE